MIILHRPGCPLLGDDAEDFDTELINAMIRPLGDGCTCPVISYMQGVTGTFAVNMETFE